MVSEREAVVHMAVVHMAVCRAANHVFSGAA